MDELTHLLVEARDGHRDALADAVRLAAPVVERFVGAMVDRADLEDVVQDTFVRAWGSLHRFRVESTGMTWLLAIARRAAADAVRRRIRQRALVVRIQCTGRSSTTVDATGVTELHDLIGRLSTDRREAFVLTQVVGLSYEEAADVCAIPIGTIRSRVSRARRDLVAGLDHRDQGTTRAGTA
jgi:RNA polymerase sigma-70 factor, ECF subfamily